MTLQIGNFVSQNVCEGCPAAEALGFRNYELEGEDESTRVSMQKANMLSSAAMLDQAAGTVACWEINKEFPDVPEPMPEVGSDDLIQYISACPSMTEFFRMINAD